MKKAFRASALQAEGQEKINSGKRMEIVNI